MRNKILPPDSRCQLLARISSLLACPEDFVLASHHTHGSKFLKIINQSRFIYLSILSYLYKNIKIKM